MEAEAPAADANSLLHRLAAGGRLSPEGLAERGVVTQELVKLCVQAMADAGCVPLTRPVQQYMKKAGGMAGEYRAMVIAAFNRDNYSGYCRKQPAAEEKRAPPAGVRAEQTLDYFLLRRSWLKGREEDAAMHRLQPVPDIRPGPAYDQAHGVIEVGAPHLVLDVDRDEVLAGGGAVQRQAKPDRGVGLRAGAPAPQDLSVGVERGRVWGTVTG